MQRMAFALAVSLGAAPICLAQDTARMDQEMVLIEGTRRERATRTK
jgi:hypothetical protein